MKVIILNLYWLAIFKYQTKSWAVSISNVAVAPMSDGPDLAVPVPWNSTATLLLTFSVSESLDDGSPSS